MTTTRPDKTASSATTTPVTGTLRADRTEVNSIYDDAGRSVVRYFTYVRRDYFLAGAPDIRGAGRRYPFHPTGTSLSWARMNTDAWELRSVNVSGVRVLKSGAPGAEVPHLMLLMREVPQWLLSFAEANRPTD
ncbi:hypothetical protein [Streptomyces sp. NBC_01244]|uniref:hypothetical protein n=1 Tax=Streptomyces sp. NBC_01244 TaxID=2903797 RepID=UPI002E10A20F|nr:hypothetical protein OG247_44050 [Streptomyces sp. NBC_01244]